MKIYKKLLALIALICMVQSATITASYFNINVGSGGGPYYGWGAYSSPYWGGGSWSGYRSGWRGYRYRRPYPQRVVYVNTVPANDVYYSNRDSRAARGFVGGALTGATVGGIVGGGRGAAIGGATGGALGLLGGAIGD